MKKTINIIGIIFVFIFIIEWSSALYKKVPLNVDRLTVVVIEETESREDISSSQLSAINSLVWRKYVEDNGGQWRVLDPNTNAKDEESWVKKAMILPERSSVPWLIVSRPERGYSGPFPENLEKLMERIKK